MHDIIAAAIWTGLVEAQWTSAPVLQIVARGPQRGLIVQGKGGRPVEYARGFDQETFLGLWRRVVARL